MVFRAAFVLLPLVAFAQPGFGPAPPPEVDRTLRTRVTEFFQLHVEGTNLRKAIDYVAEDTKEYYFSQQKMKLQSFKIQYIVYAPDFTKATVETMCERKWRMRLDLPEATATVPMSTTWKIEDGKWVWFRDLTSEQWVTPMAASSLQTINQGPPTRMPNLSPAALAEAAKQILHQASIDKAEVSFAVDKEGSDQVVFHNGYPGSVQVDLDSGWRVPGLKAELSKTSLNAGEDAVLKIQYQPGDKGPRPTVTMRLQVRPFQTSFGITVKFTDPEAANQ